MLWKRETERKERRKGGREARKEEKQSPCPCQKLTESQVYSFKVTRSTVGTLHHLRGRRTIYNNPNAQTEEKTLKDFCKTVPARNESSTMYLISPLKTGGTSIMLYTFNPST